MIRQVQKTGAPVVRKRHERHFLYRGDAQNVGIIGSCSTGKPPNISDESRKPTCFFANGAAIGRAAGIQFDHRRCRISRSRPLNPFKSLNGLGEYPNSRCRNTSIIRCFANIAAAKKGGFDRVQSHEIPAGALGYSHTVHVYLPAGIRFQKNGRILLFIFRMAKITSSLHRRRLSPIN
ncbi:MAG: hypothetical protein R3C26_26220 [Calditrichia bacterium]